MKIIALCSVDESVLRSTLDLGERTLLMPILLHQSLAG